MRAEDIRPSGALRPKNPPTAGEHDRDDAGRFRETLPGNGRGPLRASDARVAGVVHASGGEDPAAGPVPGRGQHAPGAGGAHGRPVGSDGGEVPPLGLRFDTPVRENGYVWWYVDALSDDGRHGLTVIAFIGSVFSPYYALARRRGRGDPFHHCAVNVALYGPGRTRWAMTERGRASLERSPSRIAIGPSALSWDGTALAIDLDEVTAPLPARLRGQVRLMPDGVSSRTFALDAAGRHRWSPIAPGARVAVELQQPDLRWSGAGYFDTNAGEGPLEDSFSTWNWSRARLKSGSAVLYNCEGRAPIAIRVDASGAVEDFAPPPAFALPRTRLWRMPRTTHAEAAHPVRVIRTFEDGPFYSRSVLATRLFGEPATAVHESLSLDRFRKPWVQLMLPFRMPRALRP